MLLNLYHQLVERPSSWRSFIDFVLNINIITGLGADVELLWPSTAGLCYCAFSASFNGGMYDMSM